MLFVFHMLPVGILALHLEHSHSFVFTSVNIQLSLSLTCTINSSSLQHSCVTIHTCIDTCNMHITATTCDVSIFEICKDRENSDENDDCFLFVYELSLQKKEAKKKRKIKVPYFLDAALVL